MDHPYFQLNPIEVQPLTVYNFRPYGWLLGKSTPTESGIVAFSNAETAFQEEHIFDSGVGGELQILWVIYRNRRREVPSLEVHRLSEQAIIPLTGEVIHVVASSQRDGSPDLSSLTAFRVPVGEGVCMRSGCWHTTRVDAQEVKCMMLTRRSTTIDLAAHLTGGFALSESSIAVVNQTLLPDGPALRGD